MGNTLCCIGASEDKVKILCAIVAATTTAHPLHNLSLHQKEMCDVFDKVFGVENSISIEPFTISFDEMEMSNSDNN